MNPDDPRHGTVPGYHGTSNTPGCNEECCRRAIANYNKRRKWDAMNGRTYKVPSLGAQRRIQALHALGWTRADIAVAAGWSSAGALTYITSSSTITRATHDRLATAYERLSMRLPPPGSGVRTRARASRNGWASPLAWDDIDTDPAPRGLRKTSGNVYDSRGLIDHATVDRILAGEHLPANQAERLEVMRRWLAAGRSEQSLCTRMGWKSARYTPRKEGAA